MKKSGDTRCWQRCRSWGIPTRSRWKGCTLGKPIWKTVYHLGVLKSHNPRWSHSTPGNIPTDGWAWPQQHCSWRWRGWKEPHIWPGSNAHQQEKGPIVGCSHDETFYGSESVWMPAAGNLGRSWECTRCQWDAISYKAWKDSRVHTLLLRRTWLYDVSWQTSVDRVLGFVDHTASVPATQLHCCGMEGAREET